VSARSIEAQLRDWVAEGLVTPQQAEDLRAFESMRAPTSTYAQAPEHTVDAARTAAPPRIPIAGEVLGYVGGALAIAALFAIVTQYWHDLGSGGQLALAGIVSAACMFGGWMLSASEPPQAKRLGGFLLFVGTAAVGFFAGLAAEFIPFLHTGSMSLVIGGATAVAVGFAVWLVRKTSLQLVALSLALAYLVLAAQLQWFADGLIFIGGSYLIIGIIWVILGELQVLSPRTTAWAMGSLAILSAPQIMSFEQWGEGDGYLILGCVVSLALLGAALWLNRGGPLGFGAAGIVIYVPQLLYELFENTIGVPVALLVAGVLLVMMSAVVIVVRPRLGRIAPQS